MTGPKPYPKCDHCSCDWHGVKCNVAKWNGKCPCPSSCSDDLLAGLAEFHPDTTWNPPQEAA